MTKITTKNADKTTQQTAQIIPFPRLARTADIRGNHIRFAVMPASVTGNAALNRAVTTLQQNGWHVACRHPDGFLRCSHPELSGGREIAIEQAWIAHRESTRGGRSA